MKLFSPQKTSTVTKSKLSEGTTGIKKKSSQKPVKKEMSAAEIKDKVAAHVDTSDVAKNMAIKNSKKLGEGFLSEAPKAKPALEDKIEEVTPKDPNPEGFILKSDVSANDPKDTNTQEKLKTVLSKGAFNFNPREREALEKILANN